MTEDANESLNPETVTAMDFVRISPSDDSLGRQAKNAFDAMARNMANQNQFSALFALCVRIIKQSFEIAGPDECQWIGWGLKMEDFLQVEGARSWEKTTEETKNKKVAWGVRKTAIFWIERVAEKEPNLRPQCARALAQLMSLPLDNRETLSSTLYAMKECIPGADEATIAVLVRFREIGNYWHSRNFRPNPTEVQQMLASENLQAICYPTETACEMKLFDLIAHAYRSTGSSVIAQWLNDLLTDEQKPAWMKEYARCVLDGKDVKIREGVYGALSLMLER